MGPGNECRDDSGVVARASLSGVRCVNVVGTGPGTTAEGVARAGLSRRVASAGGSRKTCRRAPFRIHVPDDRLQGGRGCRATGRWHAAAGAQPKITPTKLSQTTFQSIYNMSK